MKREMRNKDNNLFGPKNLLIGFLLIMVLLLGFNYFSLRSQGNINLGENSQLGELYQSAGSTTSTVITYGGSTTTGPRCHPTCGMGSNVGCIPRKFPAGYVQKCNVYISVPGLPSMVGFSGSVAVEGKCDSKTDERGFVTGTGQCIIGPVTCSNINPPCPTGTTCFDDPRTGGPSCVYVNNNNQKTVNIFCDSNVFCKPGYKCISQSYKNGLQYNFQCVPTNPALVNLKQKVTCADIKCAQDYTCYDDPIYSYLCLPPELNCINKNVRGGNPQIYMPSSYDPLFSPIIPSGMEPVELRGSP